MLARLTFALYLVARVGVFVSVGLGCLIAGAMWMDSYWAPHMSLVAIMVGVMGSAAFGLASHYLDPWKWED